MTIFCYCGQEYLRRNGVARIVNKRVWNEVLGCSLKKDRMISIRFQDKPFNITVIQVCAPISNAEEADVEWFYEDLQDLMEQTLKKDILFIFRDWNAKLGIQETPGVIGKFFLGLQNEAGQKLLKKKRGGVLIEFCKENKVVKANTLFQQHKRNLIYMDITRWSTLKSDWLYSLQPKMEKLYTVSENKTGSWLWLRSWTTTYCQIQT